MGKLATLDLLDADPQLFDVVLGRMTTEAKRPYEVCQEMGLSWGALLAWCNREEGRVERFRNALEVRGHLLAEDALKVSDEATPEDVSVAKLRVDTRKWLASRLNPKWFGDKSEVKHTGVAPSLTITVVGEVPRVVEGEVVPEVPQVTGEFEAV